MSSVALALALGSAFLHAFWNLVLAGTRDIQAATAVALCVGLLAVNMSSKPLTAQFEDFVLVEGKDEVRSFPAND